MSHGYEITTMELGPMENFVYLVTDLATRQAAIIDPAWEVEKVTDYADANGITITDILLTHSHHDHINGVEKILNHSDPQLHLLKPEFEFWQTELDKPTLHHGGDHLTLGKSDIQILHTPGHTPGSACYRLDADILTGDTLFVYGCGRCDLAGGDPEKMFNTLKHMKSDLPAEMVIRPGHNYACTHTATVDEQVAGNPFMHFQQCSDFIEYRMHTHDTVRASPYQAITANDLLNNDTIAR